MIPLNLPINSSLLLKVRTERQWQKLLLILLHGFFIFYVTLAIWSFQERLVGDVSQFIFKLVNYETFYLLRRWIFFFLELPTLLAVKFGASLVVIVFLYTLTLSISLYVIFIILAHPLNDIHSGAALALLLTTASSNLFYFPIELTLVLALCILLFSLLKGIDIHNLKWTRPRIVAVVMLAALIVFSYPASFVLVAFIVIFHAIVQRKLSSLHILLLLICAIYIATSLTTNKYEQGILSAADTTISLDYLKSLAEFMLRRYYFVFLLLAFTSFYYAKNRSYLKAVYVPASYIGYLLLVNYIYSIDRHSIIYLEHVYEATLIFVLIPVFGDVVPKLSTKASVYLYSTILIAVLIGLVSIMQNHQIYRDRIEFMQRIMEARDTRGRTKLILDDRNIDIRLDPLKWSLAYASYLVSSISPDTTPKTIVYDRWYSSYALPEDDLNSRYFKLEPEPYYTLNNAGNPEMIDDNFAENIEIRLVDPQTSHKPNSEFAQNVIIINNNSNPLYSGFSEEYYLYLTYHWFDESGVVVWDGVRNILEMDVHTTYGQPMRIQAPSQPGNYTLVVDLVLEGKRWFGIDSKVTVQVR